MTLRRLIHGIAMGLLGLLVMMGCAAIAASTDETPGEQFREAMKKLSERCAREKIAPGNTMCDPLKLKPADPMATPEGRFAHSIKIPNPVPEDSGYKPGMTPQEYFDHLCKTEAGEFIYKTVENVEGIYQMRPRSLATDYELQHLYVLEDPYGSYGDEGAMQEYVNSGSAGYVKYKSEKGYVQYKTKPYYQFLEKPIAIQPETQGDGAKYLRYTRPDTDKLIFEEGQYFYPRKEQPKMIEERVKELKSRYAFTWRGIRRPHDRELGIAGGELIVLDRQTNEVLAVRRGFVRSGKVRQTIGGIWWLSAGACPKRQVGITQGFLLKILKTTKAF